MSLDVEADAQARQDVDDARSTPKDIVNDKEGDVSSVRERKQLEKQRKQLEKDLRKQERLQKKLGAQQFSRKAAEVSDAELE